MILTLLLPPPFSICKINYRASISALERLELSYNAYPFRQNTKYVATVIRWNAFIMGQLSVPFFAPKKLCEALFKVTIFHKHKFSCECVDWYYIYELCTLNTLIKTLFALMHWINHLHFVDLYISWYHLIWW